MSHQTALTADDRRDSPRVPMRFLVRVVQATPGEYEAREGDLSVGGAALRGGAFEPGGRVELRFLLPGLPDEVHAQAEVVRTSEGPVSHVRFVDLPLKAELAVAKYLDDLELGTT